MESAWFWSRARSFLKSRGPSRADALHAAYAHYNVQLETQAHLLAFMDTFHVIGVITLVAAPLILATKYFKASGGKSSPAAD